MSTEGNLVVLNDRIFVPEQCRRKILKILHSGHQGITRMLQNARQSVYWHGITEDVQDICSECQECQKYRESNQKETLEADELPERPFDVGSADLFYVGKKVYMVYADRLSGYQIVKMWKNDPNTKQVIMELQHIFSLFGKPLKLRSDGGSQFNDREMKKFLDDYGILHGQSSPYNPQSDGRAERNVQIVKHLLLNTEKVGGTPNGNNVGAGRGGNQSRAKGKHPEKLDRDVDYATFLQWEKSWNLYVVSDQLDSLTDKQKTAIFFSLFSNELLSDLQYRFNMSVDADQKVEDVVEQMKTYLKGQHSIVVVRYNLFIRWQQQGESFDD